MQQPHDLFLRFVHPLGNEITERLWFTIILILPDGIVVFRPEHRGNDCQLVAVLYQRQIHDQTARSAVAVNEWVN